ncbi:hypothetical protein ACNT2N_26645 [Pseudomonas thivervalensis]|uniref:Lipoprotein n=1 Tax=Pseudomonas thivervalensis TaxID=86265 RepID=A0A2Z4ZVH5_9PSED|nr:hypothetical protein [Pseudomonas thivervalensis]AXA56692.1 hypothetical protein CE140_20740 [Pseudomonas thivervalensis]AXA62505.1 hypothetical protein CEQ51_21290 [Pseudomonas thivervalensis]
MPTSHSPTLRNLVIAVAMSLSLAALSACTDGSRAETTPTKNSGVRNSGQQTAEEQAAANEAVKKQIEEENRPLAVTFRNPGIGVPSEYLNARDSMIPFLFYNAKRSWDESADDIGDSVQDPIKTRSDNPEFYRLALERISTSDTFKKRELTEKLYEITLAEADKIRTKNLIQLTSDQWLKVPLGSYDFVRKGFAIDSCLLSDKLEYSEEEERSPALLAKAKKIRCYLNPGPNNYYLGFAGGSSIFFEVADEALAKKIESMRDSVQISIYGYVKEVQREKLGGNLGVQRYVLIAPQRVDVVDTETQATLLTKSL